MPSLHSFWATIRGRVVALLIAACLPMILVQGIIYLDRFDTRRTEELEANMEVARIFGTAFEKFVDDVLHSEAAIGAALGRSQTPLAAESARAYLDFNRSLLAPVEEYRWLDAAGRTVFSSDPRSEGKDMGEYPFLREIMEGKASA
ncbi:MAG: hypothetical protein ACLGPL_03405, partial [Acidobacteriota bacterium]